MEKVERCGYQMVKKFWKCLLILTECTNVTDGQREGQINTTRRHRPHLCTAAHCKNHSTFLYQSTKWQKADKPCVLTKLKRKPQAILASVFDESRSVVSWAVNSVASLSTPPFSYTSHRAPSENSTTVDLYRVVVVVVSGMQLSRHTRHTSTSSSTEGGSEPNLLLQGE